LILIRTDLVFRRRNRIVRQAFVVDPVTVRVSDLLVVGPIAFDGALVDIRIVELSRSHWRHASYSFAAPKWMSFGLL
jgi:hypothetical protein